MGGPHCRSIPLERDDPTNVKEYSNEFITIKKKNLYNLKSLIILEISTIKKIQKLVSKSFIFLTSLILIR